MKVSTPTKSRQTKLQIKESVGVRARGRGDEREGRKIKIEELGF